MSDCKYVVVLWDDFDPDCDSLLCYADTRDQAETIAGSYNAKAKRYKFTVRAAVEEVPQMTVEAVHQFKHRIWGVELNTRTNEAIVKEIDPGMSSGFCLAAVLLRHVERSVPIRLYTYVCAADAVQAEALGRAIIQEHLDS